MSSDKLFFSVAKSAKQAFHVIQQWQKKMRNREIIFRLSLLLLKLGFGALSRNIAIFEHRSAFMAVYVLRLLFCLLWVVSKWCCLCCKTLVLLQSKRTFFIEIKIWPPDEASTACPQTTASPQTYAHLRRKIRDLQHSLRVSKYFRRDSVNVDINCSICCRNFP